MTYELISSYTYVHTQTFSKKFSINHHTEMCSIKHFVYGSLLLLTTVSSLPIVENFETASDSKIETVLNSSSANNVTYITSHESDSQSLEESQAQPKERHYSKFRARTTSHLPSLVQSVVISADCTSDHEHIRGECRPLYN
uniref:Uncharacterized protein n=1 Tax=Photinus pyralis TaxID=7054 RepID=A0A1Y1KE53_PHOPY